MRTFYDVAERVIGCLIADGYSASCVDDHVHIMRNWVLPVIGDMPIGEISASMIAERVLDEHPSRTRRIAIQRAMTLVFDEALSLGIIDAHPLARSIVRKGPPRLAGERKSVPVAAIPPVESVKLLLAAAKPLMFRDMLLLMACCGLRCGEVRALRKDDIDVEARLIHVRGSVDRRNKPGLPKTASSYRSVPFPEALVADMTRARDESYHAQMSPFVPESDRPAPALAFPTKTYGAIARSYFHSIWWKPLLRRLGLPHFRTHDLRHFAASRWYRDGIPVQAISRWLGHSSTTITLGIYIHLFSDQADDAHHRAVMSAGAMELLGMSYEAPSPAITASAS